jgi:hypothetical protein
MAQCLKCGKETGKIHILYECRTGSVDKQEYRTEHIPVQGGKPKKRIHYRITTSYDEVIEHPFGFCDDCVFTSRKKGIRLLAISLPLILAPGIAMMVVSKNMADQSSTAARILFWAGLVTAFAGATGLASSLQMIFSGNKTVPYLMKKAEFPQPYCEENRCRLCTPREYEHLKNKGMKDIATMAVDQL